MREGEAVGRSWEKMWQGANLKTPPRFLFSHLSFGMESTSASVAIYTDCGHKNTQPGVQISTDSPGGKNKKHTLPPAPP